ncbi:MAG: PorT family protein [Niastella sp.]|nr:PorT family protein [Niastella sp.]
MKQYLLLLVTAILSVTSLAQNNKDNAENNIPRKKAGIRIGANFSTVNVKNTAGLKLNNRQGLMISGFFAPATRGIIGFRTEVVYSRQGFELTAEDDKTVITNDYLLFPQFTTINITRFFQLQVGGQVGYLLNANSKTGPLRLDMKELTNRIDYGAAGGLEIYPFKGLILGGRYSMSFGNVYKQMNTAAEPGEMFSPAFDFKSRNGVISIFLGYQF